MYLSQARATAGRAIRCPNCGATFEITPDALAYACKYCGWMGATEDVSTKGWLMSEPVSSAKAQQSIAEFLKKILKHAYSQTHIIEFKGLAVPIYIAKVHAKTHYNGYRRETRTESFPMTVFDGRGGQRTAMRTKSYPVYIPVEGEFDEILDYPVLGRKHAVFFGLEDLKKKVLSSNEKPLDVKVFLNQKSECLDVEVEEGELKAMVETMAEDENRARAEAMTTKLFDCYTDDQLLSTKLIFYPVYTAKYSYRDKSFRIAIDGSSGAIVKAELPLTLNLRIGYAIAGYAGVALATLSGLFLLDTNEPIVGIVATAIGLGLAGWSFFKATAEQRIKRG